MKRGDAVHIKAEFDRENDIPGSGNRIDPDIVYVLLANRTSLGIRRDQVQPSLTELLTELANDFETEGCQGMGTVSIETMNKVRKVLGWDLLDAVEEAKPEGSCPDEACSGGLVHGECDQCGDAYKDKVNREWEDVNNKLGSSCHDGEPDNGKS